MQNFIGIGIADAAASFRDGQRTAAELQPRQRRALGRRPAALEPMQPAGDHEMKYQPQLALQSNGDAFAEAAQLRYAPAVRRLDRRLDRSQEKRRLDQRALEALADDAFTERLHIDR